MVDINCEVYTRQNRRRQRYYSVARRRVGKQMSVSVGASTYACLVYALIGLLVVTGAVLCFSLDLWEIVATVPSHPTGNLRSVPKSMFPRQIPAPTSLPEILVDQDYEIPGASTKLGDKSSDYRRFRQEMEVILPMNAERSLRRTMALRLLSYHVFDIPAASLKRYMNRLEASTEDASQASYDIYNCPDDPPEGYPFTWNLYHTILHSWPSNQLHPPFRIHQSICIFEFEKDYEKILAYRGAEVPFVVVNDPDVAQTVERWNNPGYLERMLGEKPHLCQYSKNNHFLYYRDDVNHSKTIQEWKKPYEELRMPYREWISHANATNIDPLLEPGSPHWYYYVIACGDMLHCDNKDGEFLFDELPVFQPHRHSLYVINSREHTGIHCRFGMRGVTADAHYDKSHNHLLVLKGVRRYILTPPDQCDKLALFGKKHPSARHSSINWAKPDLETYPQFGEAKATELIMQPGEMLFLPGYWFHYVVSLDNIVQCNVWSGRAKKRGNDLSKCGYGPAAVESDKVFNTFNKQVA